MSIGSAVALNDTLRPREEELVQKLRVARERVRDILLNPYTGNSDAGHDAHTADYRDWEEIADRLRASLANAVASRECDECNGGHLHDCAALEPCEDLYDVLWRYNCEGCCPNGCRERGLQLLATETGRKFREVLGVR